MPYTPPESRFLHAIHPDRPLRWPDYADAWLNFPLGRVLDYGCGRGDLLQRVADRCSDRWGVDIDPDVVAEAARHSGAQTQPVVPGQPLRFPDAQFDTVLIIEVIEHVADERAVLTELARLLPRGGRLLLTTPHRGLLTFLDPGNFKFVAPGFHRFIHRTILRRKDYYHERFGRQRETERGMIADFTLDQRPWHRHYSYRQIRALAPPELETVAWAVYYPAFRALWTLATVLNVLTFGRVRELPQPLRWLNHRLSRVQCRLGDQLVILFEKRH